MQTTSYFSTISSAVIVLRQNVELGLDVQLYLSGKISLNKPARCKDSTLQVYNNYAQLFDREKPTLFSTDTKQCFFCVYMPTCSMHPFNKNVFSDLDDKIISKQA